MKQHIKISYLEWRSQYIISIPKKIIKELDWNIDNDTYLEISKIKNGIFLTASDKSTDHKERKKKRIV